MKNNKGFSAVIVLLVVLILLVIGFIGYYVYSNNTADPKAEEVTTSTTKSSDNSDADKYLVIKEWGIKIPTDDTVKDLTYHTNPGVNGGYLITSDELSSLVGSCDSSSVILVRGKASDIVISETSSTDGRTFQEAYDSDDYAQYPLSPRSIKLYLGEYYYLYPDIASASCTTDEISKQKEIDAVNKIVPLVKKAELN